MQYTNEFFSWDSHENYYSSEFFHDDSYSAEGAYGETGDKPVISGQHHSVSYSSQTSNARNLRWMRGLP